MLNTVLGITLARGGSKRLPHKNIKKLHSIPLIEYTIKAAKLSKHINRYMISTDDQEIAQVAIAAGADVPFLRPSHLAEDHSTTIDVCLHVLNEYQIREGYDPDIIVLLQPTSPLRTEKHIDEALNLLEQKNADSVISVCPIEYSLHSIMNMKQEGTITPYFPNSISKQFETNINVFRPNGAIYAVKTNYLKTKKSFYSEKTYPYIMSPSQSIDIDTELDFQIASFLMGKENN
ncbi:acylneuraminate cytidylyltransferase family protein [Paenibacillus sp. Soil522]|uniref:acylneuraminate cytidylyltransferase family protein n=1 Tax=Paenibacillus sp. Soil522 TaxID=1736388 RepID=UPI0006F482EF|nr:acylneuraminate cytidylyltransferase family protein [Paenibacillus sp. Soil522]KRE22284.1 hypothetical protein ASG81_29265 [Paenibacillus sp. Soil522]